MSTFLPRSHAMHNALIFKSVYMYREVLRYIDFKLIHTISAVFWNTEYS